MPFAKCPNCGEQFHLSVRSNIDEWKERFPVSEDGQRYITCFGCWKNLAELDVIEIVSLPCSNTDNITLGDRGAVVHAHSQDSYEVECVNSDGSTKWIATLPRKCLKYVHHK